MLVKNKKKIHCGHYSKSIKFLNVYEFEAIFSKHPY